MEAMAASELYDIAFGDVSIPRDVEDAIQPILVALRLSGEDK